MDQCIIINFHFIINFTKIIKLTMEHRKTPKIIRESHSILNTLINLTIASINHMLIMELS